MSAMGAQPGYGLTAPGYGLTAKGLHWGMAVLLAVLFGMAWYMTELPKGPDRVWWFGLHKSLGVLAFVFAVGRLAWNRIHPVAAPEGKPLERLAAGVVHWALYGLMLALPLAGWAMSSAKDRPVEFFGLFELPRLLGPDKALGKGLEEMHEVMAMVLLIVVALHVAAAIKHQIVDRDGTLARMMPASAPR